MGKATYIIHIFQDNDLDVAGKIKQHYPNSAHFEIDSQWFGIKSDLLSEDINKQLGFLVPQQEGEPKPLRAIGLVCRTENITGYYSSAFWEWYNNE